MKKLLSTLLILTLVLGVFTVPVYAKDTDSFEAEGFSCRILDDGTVSITDCSITRPQVSIPETLNGYSVSTLGENAFNSIRNTLTEVSIPSGVTTVGWGAFYECAELRSVVLPESVAQVEGSAFEGCTALESVALPEGLSEIAPSVFYGCSALREITIPAAVTVIRTEAFLGCESLTGITIPDKVVEIESQAFMGCHALADVKLGKSLKEVAREAFYGCENLKQIYIPANVTLIGYRAFGFWTKGSSWGESGLYITIDNTELVIRGEKGSAAEKYAEQSGLPFKEGETESNDDPGTADRPEPVDEIAMLSGMPVKVNTTWELPCVLRAPGLPAVIEGRLDYDVEGVELVTGHSDYPENGMRFELYPELYDCEYTAQPGRVTFRYTLKTGKTADDYFDARDAKEGSAQSRDLNTLQSFPLAFAAIRVIASGEYNASFSLINVVNTDGNVLYRDGEKTLSIPYGFQKLLFPLPEDVGTVSIRGDADTDGKVTVLDATRIQRYLASMIDDSGLDLKAADADLDGKVSVLDATRIQRVLANLCDMDGRTQGDEPAPPEPILPRITKASSGNNGVEIKWSAVENAEGYRVFIKNGDSWKKLGDTTATSYVHADAPIGAECVYTVRCISADGKSYTSDYDHDGYRNTRLPSPVLKSAKLIDGYVALDWEDTAGAEVYRVFIKGGDYKSWTRVGDTDISYLDMPNGMFMSDTTYSFTIRCVDPEDDARLLSGFDTKGISVHFYDMPEIYYAENTADGMLLLWTGSEGVAKYRLYYRDEYQNKWVGIDNTEETGMLLGNLRDHTDYRFTVRGFDSKGNAVTAFSSHGFSYAYSYPLVSGENPHSILHNGNADYLTGSFTAIAFNHGFETAPEDLDEEADFTLFLSYSGSFADKSYVVSYALQDYGWGRITAFADMLKRNGSSPADYYIRVEKVTDENDEFAHYMLLYRK